MRWYFERLPKAAGVNADGRVNNWWRYLYDFGKYGKDGKPLSAGSEVVRVETGLTAGELMGAELTLKGGVVSDLEGRTLPEAEWTFTESGGEWRGEPVRR